MITLVGGPCDSMHVPSELVPLRHFQDFPDFVLDI